MQRTTNLCAVKDCNTFQFRKFCFPNPDKDRERFLKWLSATGNSRMLLMRKERLHKQRICEHHFENKYKLATKLSGTAIPTIHLPEPVDVSLYEFISYEQDQGSCENGYEDKQLRPIVKEERVESTFYEDDGPRLIIKSEPDDSIEWGTNDEKQSCVIIKDEATTSESDEQRSYISERQSWLIIKDEPTSGDEFDGKVDDSNSSVPTYGNPATRCQIFLGGKKYWLIQNLAGS